MGCRRVFIVCLALLVAIPVGEVDALSLTIDTTVPGYIMDDFLNLQGTLVTTVGSLVDDTSNDFNLGTMRNLSTHFGSLELKPVLDVSMLNTGHPVLKQGRSSDWDVWFWSFGVTKANGRYYLFYSAGRAVGIDTDKDIGLAVSTDGVSFTKHSSNPVLTNGLHTSVTNPLPFYNGSWNLYYSANDGGGGANRDINGMYAYSNDPDNWTRYAQNPVIPNGNPDNVWDGQQVLTECIVDEGGSYKIYYTGDTGAGGNWDAGLATSNDGVNWVKQASNPVHTGTTGTWDNGDVKINHVEAANGTYRAFITGDRATPKVGWAWSKDGVNWQDSGSALISGKANTIYSTAVGNPSVIDEGDHYKLYALCNSGTRSIGCFKLVPERLDGTFTSRVHDAGGRVRLRNMTWDVEHTVAGDIGFELRYGNSTGSMGAWTTINVGNELANVTARYYQYRVDISVPKDWMRAYVHKVTINYEVPVTKVETIVDGGTPTICDFNATKWSTNVYLDDGDHTVMVRVTDALGDTDEVQFTAVVDLHPPTGNITLEEGRRAHNSTALLVEVSANDTHPPLEMQLSRHPDLAGATWGPLVESQVVELPGDEEGEVTFYARFRDATGRVSATYNDSIIVDRSPPVGSLLIDGGAKCTRDLDVTLYFVWADLTDVVAMMVSNDPDFEGARWIDPMEEMSWTIGEANGVQSVYARLRDAVGWTVTLTDSINLDRKAPAATLSINDDAPFSIYRDVTLDLTLHDDNPVLVKLANAGEPWPEAWRELGSPVELPWVLGPGGDGIREVRMLVRDAAGNEVEVSDDIVLDTTPPVLEVVSPTYRETDRGSLLLELSVSDELDASPMVMYRLNGGEWTTYYGPTRLRLEGGSNTIEVEARDAVGNVVTVERTVSYDAGIGVAGPLVILVVVAVVLAVSVAVLWVWYRHRESGEG